MKSFADKTPVPHNSPMVEKQPTIDGAAQQLPLGLVDKRPELTYQRKLRQLMDNSPQVRERKAWEEMANNSSVVQDRRMWQRKADNSSQSKQRVAWQKKADSSPQVKQMRGWLEKTKLVKPPIQRAKTGKGVVQRVVNWIDVDMDLDNARAFVVQDPHDRNQMETKMVIDAIRNSRLEEGESVFTIMELLQANIEGGERLTKQSIIAKLGDRYIGDVPRPEDFEEGSRERLAATAESKEGFYNWRKPSEGIFQTWLASPSDAIANDAKINCWEAIFVTAVQAGVLTKATLQERIDEHGSASAYISAIATTPQDVEVLANGINTGDIIRIDANDEENYHVVLALGANAMDYMGVPVMSNHKSQTGDEDSTLFSKTSLGTIFNNYPGGKPQALYYGSL